MLALVIGGSSATSGTLAPLAIEPEMNGLERYRGWGMAIYEMTEAGLVAIEPTTFARLGKLERQDIQKTLRTQIDAITPNVRTMVLAEEFGDWVGANRRIDLLCLDDEANLVVVELKRDDAGHMELQALRYAAMISTMRFEQAVEAHRAYLENIGSTVNPELAIREFLDLAEGDAGVLSNKVRIVLASSDFSQELTSTVLWLNRQGIDLRCVQMRPHQVGERVLLDVHQVIPLPLAEDYQVAVREKSMEQDAARVQDRDLTRYDLTLGESTQSNLPKRRLILGVVGEAFRQGLPVDVVERAADWRSNMFLSADGSLNATEFRTALSGRHDRYFTNEGELFHVGGRTYALSKMWGERTLTAVDNLLGRMPHPERVSYVATSRVSDEARYENLILRRRESGAIEIEKDGVQVAPVMPVLRQLAERLQVSLTYVAGSSLNTRQLGAAVIAAIRSQ